MSFHPDRGINQKFCIRLGIFRELIRARIQVRTSEVLQWELLKICGKGKYIMTRRKAARSWAKGEMRRRVLRGQDRHSRRPQAALKYRKRNQLQRGHTVQSVVGGGKPWQPSK